MVPSSQAGECQNSKNWVQKNKLRTYCKFKENCGLENYLTLKMNVNHRKALTNMRISAHDLHIETGRYCNIPPDERKCPFCISKIEAEEHALLRCPTYDSIRTSFYQKSSYNSDSTFKEIMSSDNPEVLKSLAKFCFDIFNTRSNSISILNLKYPIYFLSVAFYFHFNDMWMKLFMFYFYVVCLLLAASRQNNAINTLSIL